jgi:hypothetical protein
MFDFLNKYNLVEKDGLLNDEISFSNINLKQLEEINEKKILLAIE